MFQVFGFLDHRTWSVGRKTFANSVMKTSRSIARQTHELAGHHEGRPQNCSADFVDDPRQNALVDRLSLLDQRNDVRPLRSVRRTLGTPLAKSIEVLMAMPTSADAMRAGRATTELGGIPERR